MDKTYPSKTLMIVRALEKDYDPFRPLQEGEEVLDSKYPYLSAIRALMYLTNNTRPDIAFIVNLLARFSATPRYTRYVSFLYEKSRSEPYWLCRCWIFK
jgi:hypothetical protein